MAAVIQQWRRFVSDSHPLLQSWCSQPAVSSTDPAQLCFNLRKGLQSALDLAVDHVREAYSLPSLSVQQGRAAFVTSREVPFALETMPRKLEELLAFQHFKKLQATLNNCKAKVDLNRFKATFLLNDADKAQFLSKSQFGSAGFLKATPSDRSLSLSNKDLTLSLRLYLRLPLLSYLELPQDLNCFCTRMARQGISHQLTEAHLLVCHGGKVMTTRHNALANVVSDMVKAAQLAPIMEQLASEGQDARLRFDVSIDRYDGSSRDFKCDVTVVNPCSKHLVAHAAKTARYAADAKAKTKISKYSRFLHLQDDFLALVFETFGAFHPDVFKLISILSKRVGNVPPLSATWTCPTFTSYWLQRLSCCLWRENARTVTTISINTKNSYCHSANTSLLIAAPVQQQVQQVRQVLANLTLAPVPATSGLEQQDPVPVSTTASAQVPVSASDPESG